jgi:thiol-disulfide isomerase/thioredoxin
MPLLNLPLKLMKKLLFFFGLIVAAACSRAQTNTPPPAIAPYHILNTDSVYLTPANLKKNMPVMIIYFSPDCPHCQHFMNEMKPKMKAFRNIQIVMITFVTQLKAIQVFYRDYDLKKYPNFTVGTEGYSYLVQKYYHIASTPYIALYDKNHKPVKDYEKAPSIDDLAAVVKKL